MSPSPALPRGSIKVKPRSLPRLSLLSLALASLLLGSCPRAGIMPYGVEISEEGGAMVFMLVKAPVFSVPSVTNLYEPTTLIITTDTPDAEIFYTMVADAEPNTLYPPQGILLDGDVIIRARAVRNDIAKSSIVERQYNFKVPNPLFAPPSGAAPIDIQMSAISGAELFWSVTNPNSLAAAGSNPYTVSIAVNKRTLYAQARKTNWSDSDIVSHTY